MSGDDVSLRLGCFLAVFTLVAAGELMAPRRALSGNKTWRWLTHWALAALNSLLLRLGFPLLAVATAAHAEQQHWGLFNALQVPVWLTIMLSLLLLDLAIYLQHLAFHKMPLLWRLHRIHHTDTDFDVTTAIRFHPLEILLSMAIKIALVILLGTPAIAVLLFEIILSSSSLFNHGNIHLPEKLDALLRHIIVTPDMHRVHHSIFSKETNSNYGFNLPWWDKLFGTYRAQPQSGHEQMAIGLEYFRDPRELRLDRLLTQPFRTPSAGVD